MKPAAFAKKCFLWFKHHIIQIIFPRAYEDHSARRFYREYKDCFQFAPLHNNSKIRVGFFIQRAETFDAVQSIFESMLKDSAFEVYAFVIPRYDQNHDKFNFETIEPNLEFIKKYGDKCKIVNTYKDGHFIELEPFKIDYLFLCVPYEAHYPKEYSFEKLHKISKVCLTQYSFIFWDEFPLLQTSFPMKTLANCDYVFADNPLSHEYLDALYKVVSKETHKKYVYFFGFPGLDLLKSEKFTKLDTIMWIPRWTAVEKGNMSSSFMKYKDNFVNFVNEGKHTLITRPHPLMFNNYINNGIMTEKEVEEFKKSISQNGSYLDETCDFHDSIKKADLMIADFSSLVVYYTLLNKPVIYLDNKHAVARSFRYLWKSYYPANSWSDIVKIITNLEKGNDPKKEIREKVLKKFYKENPEHAGKSIANFIKREYNKGKKYDRK